MKQIILGFILIIALNACGQKNDEVKIVLDELVSYAEEASLYRNKVNWDTLKPKIYKLAKDARTVNDLIPAFKYLLKSLGDEHGRIFYNNQPIAYYYGEPKEHQKEIKMEIYNEIQTGQKYQFYSQELEGKIGYIRIVHLPMGDNLVLTKEIQDEVCKLVNYDVQSWIIDLRYNSGGNMMPMIESMATILGDGIIGGIRGVTDEENLIWKIKNGDFYMDDYSIEVQNDCEIINTPIVAVLVSSYTASSGEALSVCFKGRKNTRFFGNKTFGQVTANKYHAINDSIAFNLAQGYYQDRNENVYKKYIDVDEYVEFIREPLSEKDIAIERATEWIGKNKN